MNQFGMPSDVSAAATQVRVVIPPNERGSYLCNIWIYHPFDSYLPPWFTVLHTVQGNVEAFMQAMEQDENKEEEGEDEEKETKEEKKEEDLELDEWWDLL